MKVQFEIAAVFSASLLILNACGNGSGPSPKISFPELTTTAVSAVTDSSVQSGGSITSDGGADITARGVCWSKNSSPTIGDNITSDGSGGGDFTSTITGLSKDSTYNVRAYAVNSKGTAYGNIITFTAQTLDKNTVTDIDGNVYKTVQIGSQVWMAENLRTAKFNDGRAIPNVINNSEWADLKSPAYSWGDFGSRNADIFGPWYNWYAAASGKLAPEGWHIPSVSEWKTLADYLGGKNIAGGKMKAAGTDYWFSPNTGATNESGFSAYPAGYRNYDGYVPNLTGDLSSFWTPDEYDASTAFSTRLLCDSQALIIYNSGALKNYGYSIRCVKD